MGADRQPIRTDPADIVAPGSLSDGRDLTRDIRTASPGAVRTTAGSSLGDGDHELASYVAPTAACEGGRQLFEGHDVCDGHAQFTGVGEPAELHESVGGRPYPEP